MFFTQEDYKKIQQWLTKNSVKDTEFNEVNIPFNGNEIVSIVQGDQNKRVFLKDLVSQIFNLGVSDFVNITDKYNAPNISLEEAVRLIPPRARKEGQVITFLDREDHWHIYQFKGVLNQWNVLDQWEDLFDWEKLVINSILPDEEDLTKSLPDENGNSYLSLKDREYNPDNYSGLGRIILRKNIVEVEDPIYGKVKKNVLYQDMINKENTIYEIRYDFILENDITLPVNCVLKFEGGSISGPHTLTGTNTLLLGSVKCFVTIAGTFANDYLDVTWFGAIGDDDTDCIDIFHNILDVCIVSVSNMYIPEGTYAFKRGHFDISCHFQTDNPNEFLDCKFIKIYGDNPCKTILKEYIAGDVINLAFCKNIEIYNLSVTQDENITLTSAGVNCISLINICNITIHDVYCYNGLTKVYYNYGDGGAAFSIQSKIADNIKIYNCYAYNCWYGFGIAIYNPSNRPTTNLEIHNCIAEKCYAGFVLVGGNNSANIIKGGIAHIEGKTMNCLTSIKSQHLQGYDVNINVINTESIDTLAKNKEGEYWIPKDLWSSESYSQQAATIAWIDDTVNSKFVINASAVEYSTGFFLKEIKNSVFQLTLNKEASYVQLPADRYTGTAYNGLVPLTGKIDVLNSVIIINANETEATGSLSNFGELFTRDRYNTYNTIILNGTLYTYKSVINKLYSHRLNGGDNIPSHYLSNVDGSFAFIDKSTNNPVYPAIRVGAEVLVNGVLTPKTFGGLTAYGDILRESITGSPQYTNNRNQVAGGLFIDVKSILNATQVLGFIPVYKQNKGTTNERNSFDVSSITSGYCWFDTTLNKPVWYKGNSKWVDATGAEV